MHIDLTINKAKSLAKSLRTLVNGPKEPAMTMAGSLEAIAELLGYPNWDTLHGVLVKEETKVPSAETYPPLTLHHPITLYLPATALGEFNNGPDWVKLRITHQAYAEWSRLNALRQAANSETLTADAGPETGLLGWDKSFEDDLGICDWDTITVGSRHVYFTCCPRYADFDCESRSLDLHWLTAVLAGKADTAVKQFFKFVTDDIMVYSSSGEPEAFINELIAAGELPEQSR